MADDFTSTTGTAGSVTLDTNGTFGDIETAGDSDWFKVDLVAGTSYLLTLRGLDGGDGTLVNPILRLHGPNSSTEITSDDNSGPGNDSEIIFVASQSGTYYLDAQSANGGIGSYAVAAASRIDPPADAGTTATIDVNAYTAHADMIESGTDVDWYRVHLDAGTTYAFDMLGNYSKGSLPNPFLSLYGPDSGGNQFLAFDDDSGEGNEARILYTPAQTGDYYLAASSSVSTDHGTYWLYAAPSSGLTYADAILTRYDQSWAPDPGGPPYHWTITYSFMQSAPSYALLNGDASGFQLTALTPGLEDAIRGALKAWSDLTDITFQEVSDAGKGGTIRFGVNDGSRAPNNAAYTKDYPSPYPYAGDIWLNKNDASFGHDAPGEFGFMTLLHEIGHALGLKHPEDVGNDADMTPYLTGGPDDSRQFTLMSYNPDTLAGTGSISDYFEPMTPMLYDIDAIQYLYGADTTLHSGDDTYSFNGDSEILMAIWDPRGKDTFDAHTLTSRVIIDLNQFHMSSIGPKTGGGLASQNVGIANGSVIENAIGGDGNDKLIGNSAKNQLTGNAGKDTLTGAKGDDTLDGGSATDSLNGGPDNDTYVVTSGDVITDSAGKDTIKSAISWSLADNPTIENLILTGEANVDATGNDLKNTLTGNKGNNLLNGGDAADLLRGGQGNDIFVWDAADAVVAGAIQGGDGSDTLRVTGTHTLNLAALTNTYITNIEKIALTGDNDVVKMNYADIHATSGGTSLTISGDAGDKLYLLGGGWSYAGDATLGTAHYDHWINAAGGNSVYWAALANDAILG